MMLAAWIVGRQSSRWFFNDLFTGTLEAFVFHAAIGFTFLSYAFFGLACVGLYRRPIVGGVVLLLAAAGCVSAPRSLLRAARSLSLPRAADLAFVLCAGAAVACASIAALAPETEYDALWYHLFLPARWLAAGRPVRSDRGVHLAIPARLGNAVRRRHGARRTDRREGTSLPVSAVRRGDNVALDDEALSACQSLDCGGAAGDSSNYPVGIDDGVCRSPHWPGTWR